MRTYSESRIELRNLQMLKKLLEDSTHFLSSEQPCGAKSLNISLNIAGRHVGGTNSFSCLESEDRRPLENEDPLGNESSVRSLS